VDCPHDEACVAEDAELVHGEEAQVFDRGAADTRRDGLVDQKLDRMGETGQEEVGYLDQADWIY
jgi:hypothetical protein